MSTNEAAWMDAPYAELTVREADMPTPQGGDVVVQVRAVAVNPLDAIIQSNGRLMYRWLDYPVVLGEDVAGVVVDVGPNVTGFSVGDRVIAFATGVEKGRNARTGGGFQRFVAVAASVTSLLPPETEFADAVVLPLAFSTAAAALFEVDQLGLRYDTLDGTAARDDVVVVWGGATSVGSNAIQLARAAGYRVATTASPRNHQLMRDLGAETVVDYRDPRVVHTIVAAIGDAPVAGIFAIPTGSGAPSLDIAVATGAKRIALASPPVSFWTQPRRAGLSVQRIRMLTALASKSTALQIRASAHRIRARFVWGSSIVDSPVGPVLWGDYLPKTLADGTHRLAPEPHVIGTELSMIQSAVDAMRTGISAQKLVILLDQHTS